MKPEHKSIISRMAHVPSDEQISIWNWLANPTERRNLVVRARAGTAKTYTITGGFFFAPESKILYAVFNKKNQLEAQGKILDKRVEVKTLHSLGFSFIKKLWISAAPYNDVEFDRIREALRKLDWPDSRDLVSTIIKLVGFCKNLCAGIPSRDEIMAISDERDIFVDKSCGVKMSLDQMAEVVERVLEISLERDSASRISFDDMVWLPVALGIVKPIYDLVVVDECQDMNLPQLEMARRACKPDGRIVCVGDDRQAIYGFRGAAQNGMEKMRKDLDAESLPLTVTRRCPKAVVALAQKYVPDYRAADDAPDGLVASGNVNSAAVGDAILSRLNAPLMALALSLLRQHIPARIEGRDIGKQLLTMVKTFKAQTILQLTEKIEAWKEKQIARLAFQKNSEKKVEQTKDIAATLHALADGCGTVYDLEHRINLMFGDTDQNSKAAVVLSTVHKAKGLEWDRVFILSETFRSQKWSNPTEESNIYYVAITRTKKELYLVGSGEETDQSTLDTATPQVVQNEEVAKDLSNILDIPLLICNDLHQKTDQKSEQQPIAQQLTDEKNMSMPQRPPKIAVDAPESSTATKSKTDDQSISAVNPDAPRHNVVRSDNYDIPAGMQRRKVGDVILFADKVGEDAMEYAVIGVNQSCARIQPINECKTVSASLRHRNGSRVEVGFAQKEKVISISNTCHAMEIVRRLTEVEIKNFMAGKRPPAVAKNKKQDDEGNEVMAKNKKTKEKGGKRQGKMAWILALLSGKPGVTKREAVARYVKQFPGTLESTARATVSWCCSSPKGLAAHNLKSTVIEEERATPTKSVKKKAAPPVKKKSGKKKAAKKSTTTLEFLPLPTPDAAPESEAPGNAPE